MQFQKRLGSYFSSHRTRWLIIIALFVLMAHIQFIKWIDHYTNRDTVENTNLSPHTIRKLEILLSSINTTSNYDDGKTLMPIYHWDKAWITDENMCKDPKTQYRRLPLSSSKGNIQMYTYDNSDYISRVIFQTAHFEPNIDRIIKYFLQLDSEINFIDIGANIGHRSLLVGKMGRKVISVEALEQNVKLFCASAYLNMLDDNITIINNAIGNKHEVIRMVRHKNSFGSAFVNRKDMRDTVGKLAMGTFNKAVHTITFDDLLQLDVIKYFRKVFIKMDIEGYENVALKGAIHFFNKIDVVGIIMEWRFHRHKKSGYEIINFMQNHSFLPYHDNINNLQSLQGSENASYDWPHDVLWINTKLNLS